MFATNSFASKVFSAFAVLLILASIIMGTDIRLTSMTLYEWIIILVLIFGGAGFVAKVLFASNGSQKGGRKNKSEEDFKGQAKSIDDQLEEIKKNMK